jgi:hypothetical protein
MVFVPEGQPDSSQARSAWVKMQKGAVPEGRLNAWSVLEIICRRKRSPGRPFRLGQNPFGRARLRPTPGLTRCLIYRAPKLPTAISEGPVFLARRAV